MRKDTQKKINKRKRKLQEKLKKRNWQDQPCPMLSGRNIHYDFDGRYSGLSCGGIGIIHQMVQSVGLTEEINSKLDLLKRHLLK